MFSAWRHPDEHGQHDEQAADPVSPKTRIKASGVTRLAASAASDEIARERRDAEPDHGEDEAPPASARPSEHAEIGGDALAALEARARPGRGGRGTRRARRRSPPSGAERPAGDEHRDGALQRVGDQRRRGEVLPAGAQHVGRADVARADGADVAEAGEAASGSGRRGSSRADSRSAKAAANDRSDAPVGIGSVRLPLPASQAETYS